LSSGYALLVHSLEPAERHVHFAANLHQRRMLRPVQLERQVAKRSQVRRDGLTDDPVAARRSLDEHAVAIGEADSRAVDLELAVVARAAHLLAGHADDPLLPRRQFLLIERVGQRQHRHEVRVLGELAHRLGADALRR
jgi:hypothetical protein